jgi:multisubunit Na+/H+ antiporter MnhF subunit
VNAFLIAATALVAMVALPGIVMLRARMMDAVAALELASTTLTLALLCLCEGFHRSVYFNVPIVAAGATWVGNLIFVRFVGRFR